MAPRRWRYLNYRSLSHFPWRMLEILCAVHHRKGPCRHEQSNAVALGALESWRIQLHLWAAARWDYSVAEKSGLALTRGASSGGCVLSCVHHSKRPVHLLWHFCCPSMHLVPVLSEPLWDFSVPLKHNPSHSRSKVP